MLLWFRFFQFFRFACTTTCTVLSIFTVFRRLQRNQATQPISKLLLRVVILLSPSFMLLLLCESIDWNSERNIMILHLPPTTDNLHDQRRMILLISFLVETELDFRFPTEHTSTYECAADRGGCPRVMMQLFNN
jgi:hypothetical protein